MNLEHSDLPGRKEISKNDECMSEHWSHSKDSYWSTVYQVDYESIDYNYIHIKMGSRESF